MPFQRAVEPLAFGAVESHDVRFNWQTSPAADIEHDDQAEVFVALWHTLHTLALRDASLPGNGQRGPQGRVRAPRTGVSHRHGSLDAFLARRALKRSLLVRETARVHHHDVDGFFAWGKEPSGDTQ